MIEHSKPTITRDDIVAVAKVMRSNFICDGKIVEEFERQVCRYIGVRGGVATSSGELAIHLALLAMGVSTGDEVLLPTYLCREVLDAINYTGARGVLVDNEEDGFNISTKDIKNRLSKRTKAIIVPHMLGIPADIENIKGLGVPVIEDCAQSMGASVNDKKVGSFGDLAIFSFHAIKMMTTGEGGLVVTNDTKLLEKLRYSKRQISTSYTLRYFYPMTNMQAALGISQLRKLENFILRRREIAKFYLRNLENMDVRLPEEKNSVFFRFPIRTERMNQGWLKAFDEKGVCARRPVEPTLHHLLNLDKKLFPSTEDIWRTTISIPIYPSLTDEEQNLIIKACQEIF